ncbi:Sushi, von Willebrand factor type A, EGF and pentraxin domain-containing protein 1 [Symbiodinium microadriaticum]|uniref:Sushi, von Willebrand factor type A, EGF and pentraxin domain-containing protein 1 n=1 Tax=Symbiodinium microadriaticum TaxID=2951 RepID=A0A1Q9DJQ5_SYMMI|nr:Sushi, von Willebrand factor type A, EGF and pentraxin domain-containing protein 1 [Symbiodinium microadriaticum]
MTIRGGHKMWLLLSVVIGMVESATVKVMMLHNSFQANAGWKEGFYDFFVPYVNIQGFTIAGGTEKHTLDVSLCEEDLSTADASTKVTACVNQAEAQGVDAIVVGTSSYNDDVKTAAEAYGIPNLHCSGGNPMSWTAATPHAFGLHLPFPWYSRGPIRQAALLELKTVVVIRNYDWGFPRISAVAAMEWSLESSMQIIGPTLAWCQRWANKTTTCGIQNGNCRCGTQSEFDNMGYKYNVADMPSFYEVSEALVVEPGFDTRGPGISPALVEFVEGIIQDVRSQGGDPDMVVNWLAAARSGLMAMMNQKFGYRMYFGGPNYPGTAWNGYETYWANGSVALGQDQALYNIGGGQWHHEMGFSDPIFGSSAQMKAVFIQQFGKNPGYDAAACMAAGISITFGLQKYGQALDGLTLAQRREEIRMSVGTLNDETLYGMIRFNRFNQNNGRMSVNWQILEDGDTRPVLPPEAAATPFRFPSPSWEARLGCPVGTYAGGTATLDVPTQCILCPEGRFRDSMSQGLNFSECQQCPEGVGTLPGVTGSTECSSCPAGRYQNGESDRGVCNQCPLGTARAGTSTGGCSLCDSETYADERGLDECKPCPARSSQSDVGQTFCLCDVGSYKDPEDATPIGTVQSCLACELILPGSTTLYPSSKYSHECVCPAGTFWHRTSATTNVAECKECGTGLNCKGGRVTSSGGRRLNATIPPHQPPLQSVGYSAGAQPYEGGDPAYIVECSSSVRCPGDLPLGECPGNNRGKGCLTCLPNNYDDGSTCLTCEGGTFTIWPLFVALIAAVVLVLVLYKFATKVDKPHRDSLMTVTIGAGLAIATVQTLSAFSKVEVQWVEPLKTLRGFLSFLTFDIGILRPGCWFGNVDPLQNYIGSLMMYPMGAGAVMLVFAIAKYVLKKEITLNQVINAQGLIVSAVFIALTFLAVKPFQCVGNPDGTSSLAAFRDVICWENADHFAMVGLSLLPFFGGVVTFMGLVIWAVIQYPMKVAKPGGVNFVKRWNFMFARFSPTAYYFAFVLNMRNLLIGLIPVLLVEFAELQFIFLTITVSVYTVLQARIWPWRTSMSNYMDSCLALFLITVIVVGSMLLDFDVQRGTVFIQIILMIGTVLAFIGLVFLFGMATYRAYRPSRTYGIFLSHHKLGAAVLSRWWKMMLSEHIKDKVFLDSDDVNKLDAIIDVTAWDSQNVVVLMTQETLKRMWCAAEIASAWAANTNIVLVSCDGNGFSDELIQSLPSLWTEEQQATLANAGVTMKMIVDSYEGLKVRTPIGLNRKGAKSDEHEHAVQLAVSQCKGLSKRMFGKMARSSSTPQAEDASSGMVMLGDLTTPESGSCCKVIQSMLQSKLQESVAVLDPEIEVSNLDALSEKYANAKVILVILTQGLLQDALFAGALATCPVEVRGNLVPIKADENFIYPDPVFWEKLAAGQIFSATQLATYNTDFEGVRAAYARLFNVLALKFTSHGSESIQSTEIQVMNGRLAPMLAADKIALKPAAPNKQASTLEAVAPASDKGKVIDVPPKEEILEEEI